MKTLEFINECLTKLGLSPDIRIVILTDDHMLDRFSTSDYKLEAILHKTAVPLTYVLYLRPGAALDKAVIAHEMIHLEQYERGDLAFNPNTGAVTWKGKAYSASSEYMSRPWEVEAFRRQKDLIKSEQPTAKPKKSKPKK